MDLAALELLDVDDIEVVETDELLASASPGVVHAPGPHYHRHCATQCSAPHCHPIEAVAHPLCYPACGPVHTHEVGDLPDGSSEL